MAWNKRTFKNVSIRTRLTLLTATAITLAVAVAAGISLVMDLREFSRSKARQLTAIAEVLSNNSTAAVAFGQQQPAEDLLRSAESRFRIRGACIFDSDHEVFASYQREGETLGFDPHLIKFGANYADNGFLEVAVPIVDHGESLGTLVLRESTDDLSEAIRSRVLAAIAVLAGSILIGVFASSQLQESVTAPILNLASTAQKISDEDDRGIRVEHDCDDEIGVLYDQFNNMLDRVESREKAVQQARDKLQELNEDLERRVCDRTFELEQSNRALQEQVRQKDAATAELHQTHAQLLEASRRAGMADIANGVLHNIGNVLNSLNISANLIEERLRNLRINNLQRAVELLQRDRDEVAEFLLESEKGQLLPQYLGKLGEGMREDQQSILAEVESLASNVEHIKDIVRAQQSHAGAFGVVETVRPESLFDHAVHFVQDSFTRHRVDIVKEYEPTPSIQVEKSKIIQIVVNLIKNAKESVLERGNDTKKVTLRLRKDEKHVCFEVTDTGIGIPPERLTQIFSSGFTTKPDGHGFGLHASANAAREMGGKLTATSDGIGKGATFCLSLPARIENGSDQGKGLKVAG